MPDIQGPGSVLGEARAGTERSEEQAQGARLVCALAEARVRPRDRLAQWAAGGEPEIQAAGWTAVEAVEAPGLTLPTQGQAGPGWGEQPLNLGRNRRPAYVNTTLRNSLTSTTYTQQGRFSSPVKQEGALIQITFSPTRRNHLLESNTNPIWGILYKRRILKELHL